MSKKRNKRLAAQNFNSLNSTENSDYKETTEVDTFNNQKQPNFFRRLNKSQKLWAVGIIALLSLGVLGSGLKYLEESAKQEKAANAAKSNFDKSEPSLLSKINPFMPTPTPTQTPQLSKEYIYAGSRMLAVEDANANAAPPADLAVWRKSTGYWYVLGGQGSAQTSFQWGGTDDEAVAGDYDGDGKTDFAVWRHSNGTWYISTSSSGGTSYLAVQFGIGSGSSPDKPVPADYDGDGKTDIAVYRPSTGYWYVQSSSNTTVTNGYYFGNSTDKPAPADYDGDGKADLCVWRPGDATFYTLKSSGNFMTGESATLPQTTSDQVVSADYDGDGKVDYAIRYNATWIVKYSSTGTVQSPVSWYSGSDVSVQNDYDGDGKVDIAVWNASTGNWFIRQSLNNQTRTEQWGGTINGTPDIPVPAYYRR